jgi:hypothetical protein
VRFAIKRKNIKLMIDVLIFGDSNLKINKPAIAGLNG